MAENNGDRPLVLITGASGTIGSALIDALGADYRVVGLDREDDEARGIVAFDITDGASVDRALDSIWARYGKAIAAVVHLAAYFDFSGEPNPLYEDVNVQGTRTLLAALKRFAVDRFIYAGTMLVHRAAEPGARIDESAPFDPAWAYPESKKAAEDAIRADAVMPYAILRLAGLYDDKTMVPTLAHQIARIHEKSLESHLYAGPRDVGQAMLHRDDMIAAIKRTIDRRRALPAATEILIGEPETLGYGELQDRIGELLHGADEWKTLRIPAAVAKVGAYLEEKAEPLVPDAIDHGEEPFIKPFMIDQASSHYALDISRARDLLGWQPRRRLADELPAMIANLKRDPAAWYEANGMTPPD